MPLDGASRPDPVNHHRQLSGNQIELVNATLSDVLDDYLTSGCAPSSSNTTTTISTFWFELSAQTESIFFLR